MDTRIFKLLSLAYTPALAMATANGVVARRASSRRSGVAPRLPSPTLRVARPRPTNAA